MGLSTTAEAAVRAPATATSAASHAQSINTTRYHYLDNLRALAMLAGVLFHVGAGYSVIIAGVWPTANAQTSPLFDCWIWILHSFRMPLFFLISGFFAHYLINKRGPKGFLRNRALRIGLPFIIFWPLVTAALVGLMIYAAFGLQVDTPVIRMVRLAIENPEAMNGKKMPISTTHLWFLYYLCIFCLAAAAIYKFLDGGQKLYSWLSRPAVLVAILPLITTGILSREFIPHGAPDSFIPAVWALGFFGLFFMSGWVLFVRQEVMAFLARAWPYLGVSTVVASVVLVSQLPPPVTLATVEALLQQPQAITSGQLLRAGATAVLAWHGSFLCLLAAYRLLNRKHAQLRYLADGSYWVYIVHFPTVCGLQYLFHARDLPLAAEFLLISGLTLGFGYLSYALLVRPTPLGRLLNGRARLNENCAVSVPGSATAPCGPPDARQ